MGVRKLDPRDDDSTTGSCGPTARCLQCKKTARILRLDQRPQSAAAGLDLD